MTHSVGSWNISSKIELTSDSQAPSVLDAHKGKVVTAVALLALGALLAGGLLLYFKVHTIAAWSLIGGGSAFALADLIAGLVFFIRYRKAKEGYDHILDNQSESPGTFNKAAYAYTVVSWNIGTLSDYSNMCSIKNKMMQHREFVDVYQEVFPEQPSEELAYQATEEEKNERKEIFQRAFTQFDSPDIICLQETGEMRSNEIQDILPDGYTFLSYGVDKKTSTLGPCVVAWKIEKFTHLDTANISYDPEAVPSLSLRPQPDTVVLLRDTQNGATICVGSAHLKGFSLAYNTLNEGFKKHQLNRATYGNNQANYDLKTMEIMEADLYIYAGDFNATWEHYPERLNIPRSFDYAYARDDSPTIYDANLREDDGKTPKPVKLDHIFAKAKNVSFSIEMNSFTRTELNNFHQRPSDHLPIGARVAFL